MVSSIGFTVVGPANVWYVTTTKAARVTIGITLIMSKHIASSR